MSIHLLLTSDDVAGKSLHCDTPALQLSLPEEAAALNSVHFHIWENGLLAPTSATESQGSANASVYKQWEVFPML